MKKVFIITMIITLTFFSCKKEEAQGGNTASVAGNALDTAFSAGNYGYALRINASFFTLETDTGEDGVVSYTAKYASDMSLGERVSTGEKLTGAYNGRDYDFVRVRREDGATGVAIASQISDGGNLMVVIDEKTNLFRSPKAVDITNTLLPRKIVGVFFPETEKDGFVEIRAYDPTAQAYRQNYVRTGTLSRKASDIQSSIMMQTAESFTREADKIRRDYLLDLALMDYPDSVFSADITALITPNVVVIQTELVDDNTFVTDDDDDDFDDD